MWVAKTVWREIMHKWLTVYERQKCGQRRPPGVDANPYFIDEELHGLMPCESPKLPRNPLGFPVRKHFCSTHLVFGVKTVFMYCPELISSFLPFALRVWCCRTEILCVGIFLQRNPSKASHCSLLRFLDFLGFTCQWWGPSYKDNAPGTWGLGVAQGRSHRWFFIETMACPQQPRAFSMMEAIRLGTWCCLRPSWKGDRLPVPQDRD